MTSVHNFCTHIGEQGTLLTHKQLEMHGCIISTLATDVLVPSQQAISNYSTDL